MSSHQAVDGMGVHCYSLLLSVIIVVLARNELGCTLVHFVQYVPRYA